MSERSLLKLAEAGVVGSDRNFERSFANLAHVHVRSKAPMLTKYEVGFQVIDKNEDYSRAVGVIGYKIGTQLAYVPVFFDNGELKGSELLYLKGADIFVPLEQNWVNYLINRQSPPLGKTETRNLSQLGVISPDLSPLRGYLRKYAEWLRPGLPGLAWAAQPRNLLKAYQGYEVTLPSLVRRHVKAAECLVALCDRSPTLAAQIGKYYGTDLIRDAIRLAKSAHSLLAPDPPKAPQVKSGSILSDDSRPQQDLEIFVYTPGEQPKGLTEKEAQSLKRKGIYIRDRRDNRSKLYTLQESLTLENPTETSFYQVLLAPDNFKRCLVVVQPIHRVGKVSATVVVQLDSGDRKKWSYTRTGEIWVASRDDKAFENWIRRQRKAKTLETGKYYLLVGPNGDATAPFKVEFENSADNTSSTYKVLWYGTHYRNDTWAAKDRPAPGRATDYYAVIENVGRRERIGGDGMPVNMSAATRGMITIGRLKGNKFLIREDIIYAPEGAVAVPLAGIDEMDPENYPQDKKPGDRNMVFGTPAELQYSLHKSAETLKLYADDMDVWINDRRMSRKAGLIQLVRDYGLSEKSASLAIQKAQQKRGVRFFLKRAQGGGILSESEVTAPVPQDYADRGTDNFMNADYPTNSTVREAVPYEMPFPAGPPPKSIAEPPAQLVQQLEQAANTGQTELFDTSMLSAMVDLSGEKRIVDDAIPPMMKGMNAIGRTLFNMYWHRQIFEERFGEKDLVELEDALQSAFDQVGKVVLKLRQRTVDTFDLDDVDVDIENIEE